MKPIKFDAAMTQLIRKNCAAMVEDALKQSTLSTKFNLTVDLKDVLPKYAGGAELIFSAKAYTKLISMVMHDNREVAVHGSVQRCEAAVPTATGFFVDDVYVYPQETTAATVEASDAYGYWIAKQPEDIFNRLRFQAHSHVNMGVSPSSVDQTFYHRLMVEVQDFYIFIIINKRMEVWCEIYDIENNVLYETADVSTNVVFSNAPGDDNIGFTKALKELVVPRVWTMPAAEEKKTVAPKALPAITPIKTTTTKKQKKYDAEEKRFMRHMEDDVANPTMEQIHRYMQLLER